MSEFVLIIGDFHIPNKATDLPTKFNEYLVPGKITHVICTGNVGNVETLDRFKKMSDNFIMVRGDCDEMEGIPLTQEVEIGNIKFGVIHGHQCIPWDDEESLKSYQRELGCDILVHGHTHKSCVKKLDGSYFINPGSATGAFSPLSLNNKPSFILLKIEEDRTGVVYEYTYDKNATGKKEKISQTVLKL